MHTTSAPCSRAFSQPGPRHSGRWYNSTVQPLQASAVEVLQSNLSPSASGKLESTSLDSGVRQRVQDAIETLRYEVTAGDVAARAGVTVEQAEEALTALAADTSGTLKVSGQGDILYAFRSDFKSVLLSRSLSLRLQPGLKAASQGLALAARIAFGAALVTSVAVVYFSIFALMNASSNDRESSRSSRRSYMSTYIFTDALDLLLYPRGRYYRTHRGRPISDEMGFLEAVFSFVLGDGNPNAAYEEERWQRVGAFIKSRGGVVTAEELAPYLDHAQGYSASDSSSNDESYVVPALVRFGGSPEVDDQGNLLYQFPSLQVSGSLPSPRSVPAQPALEKEWTLTKAKAGQKTGAAFLGAVNLVGVAILQSILTSRNVALAIYHGTEVGAYALWIGRLMPFLQIYAASFFILPAVRWALNQSRNKKIQARNEARTTAQAVLQSPDRQLRSKLDSARAAAKHRRISEKDVIYRSDKSQGEQDRDVEAEDFDRRLQGTGALPQDGRAGQSTDALSRVRELYRQSQNS